MYARAYHAKKQASEQLHKLTNKEAIKPVQAADSPTTDQTCTHTHGARAQSSRLALCGGAKEARGAALTLTLTDPLQVCAASARARVCNRV